MAVTGSPTSGNDVLTGDNANDFIKALGGNDRMSGGGGRDTAWGEAGNDDFDGGSGTDIAAYKDVFADFTISVVNGVTQVKHRDNQETTWDGNDKLTNVERLQFADRIVLLANDLGPVANGDTASTAEDAALVFDGTPGKNLLSNDTDADGDALKVTWVGDISTDAKGAVGIVTVSNGVVTFTPRQDFSGTATFAYQVTDQIGAAQDYNGNAIDLPVYQNGQQVGGMTSGKATVTVTVTPVNDTPSKPTDTNAAANSVAENAASGTVVGVTANSTDVDGGDTITYYFDVGGNLVTNDGRFAIDGTSGVVTVHDGTKLDFENAASHTIKVVARDSSTPALSASENFTIAVGNVQEGFSGAPVITKTATGSPKAGEVLTATQGTLTDPDGIKSITYRWQSQEGGQWKDIAGATGSSYTLTAGESGEPVRAVATLTDDLNATAQEASNAFSVEAAPPPLPNGFQGDTIQYSYVFPSHEDNHYTYTQRNITVGDDIEIFGIFSNDGIASINVSNNKVEIDFNQGVGFSTGTFNGFKLTDIAGVVPDITNVTVASNNTMLPASGVSFDANNIYVNWQGLSFDQSGYIALDVVFG